MGNSALALNNEAPDYFVDHIAIAAGIKQRKREIADSLLMGREERDNNNNTYTIQNVQEDCPDFDRLVSNMAFVKTDAMAFPALQIFRTAMDKSALDIAETILDTFDNELH